MNSRSSTRDWTWYFSRLKVMEPREIAFRIADQISLKGLELSYRWNRKDKEPEWKTEGFGFCSGSKYKLPSLNWSFNPESPESDKILAGKIKALGCDWKFEPGGECWHRAPDTGKIWPRHFFGKIPFREGNPYGDVRTAWEPSRLQHLIPLALIARSSDPVRSHRAITLLEDQFLSWTADNPFLQGIHYISVMECALRLIALCHTFDLVRNHLLRPRLVWPRIIRLVKDHAELIEDRLSLYSSLGNHTIAESVALVYAGFTFPEFEMSERCKRKGIAILESESNHQILADGGGAEQSFGYLSFILDLYELAYEVAKFHGTPLSPRLKEQIGRGREFLNQLSIQSGSIPPVGDYDQGVALSPYLDFPKQSKKRETGLVTFPGSGYSVIHAKGEDGGSLLIDHGSLGMPPSFGHGHADALSVQFSIGEKPVLIDPGTYTYVGNPLFRRYLKGTSAHNTVTVDEQDQADQIRSFIWSAPYSAGIVAKEHGAGGLIRILTRHSGYRRLPSPVEHFRGITYRPPGIWIIWDYLTGKGNHTLDLNWNLDTDFSSENGRFTLLNLGQPAAFSIQGGTTEIYRGSHEPVAGWRSRRYGTLEPVATLRTRYRGALPHEFITILCLNEGFNQNFSLSTERFCFKWNTR